MSANRSIVISKFQIYQNGILAEAQSYVEDCELFLDDVIGMAVEKLGVTIVKDEPIRNGFLSNIEVEAENPFTKTRVKSFEQISKFLISRLKLYGNEVPGYEQSGFTLHFDITNRVAPIPTNFKLERRDGSPYSSNLYFCSAPLKTQDQLDLLEQFEASF